MNNKDLRMSSIWKWGLTNWFYILKIDLDNWDSVLRDDWDWFVRDQCD